MKTRILKISVAVLGVLVLVGTIFLWGASREVNFLKEGSVSGFNLTGVYRDHKSGLSTLSFHAENNNRWQVVETEGTIINGTFKTTDDPNMFSLIDKDGNEYGVVRLAYVSSKEDDGRLYLTNKSGTILFDKITNLPGFVVDATTTS